MKRDTGKTGENRVSKSTRCWVGDSSQSKGREKEEGDCGKRAEPIQIEAKV